MTWTIHVARPAARALERAPQDDRRRIRAALEGMCENPFTGDIAALKDQPAAFRRRVGSFRIFFDAYPDRHLVVVTAIARRTSTTYR